MGRPVGNGMNDGCIMHYFLRTNEEMLFARNKNMWGWYFVENYGTMWNEKLPQKICDIVDFTEQNILKNISRYLPSILMRKVGARS